MAHRKPKGQGFFKRNMIGIIIAAIMVFSGIGFFAGEGTPDSNSFSGHRFTAYNNKWYTTIDGKTAGFNYHPSDVQRINLSSDVTEYLKNVKMIYITFDPNSSLIQDFELMRMELEQELPEYFGVYPVTGVTMNSTQYQGFPIIDCSNATVFVPVLYLKQGETQIIPQGSCLILQAQDSYDVPALKDRLIYSLFGIL